MKSFSHETRQQNLKTLSSENFDLAIIGGGIVGAGIARDAASRGMKVALVEKADFASGTSSRSSKLIHGGIRYLENLEFGLVFEALNEREKLYTIAPHLVHPLRFILPIYKNSRVGMFKMGLGMWLYDALALFQAELHEQLNAKESLERLPWLKPQDLSGAYVYSDAYMDDDRLTIETLRSANNLGACIVNYTTATGAEFSSSGKISALICKDNLSEQTFSIKAQHFVSCVGPWTDNLGSQLFSDWQKILRPTKGIHITLRKERLKLDDAVVMAVDKENRIVFGIPRHEMVIIGTTDTDFKDSPDQVVATAEDVKYLLKIANEYFPGAQLTHKDIVATYAGVRPLVNDSSESEGKTSREHSFLRDPRGILFVAGGKYTTYRHISQQAVELVLQSFTDELRVRFNRNDTESPLNPLASIENLDKARLASTEWAQNSHLPEKDIRALVERHGLEAKTLITNSKGLSLSYWEIEARHAIQNTMCMNLVDFYTRRSPLFLAERDHGLGLIDVIALNMQSLLLWTDNERERQKQLLLAHIQRELAWQNNIAPS